MVKRTVEVDIDYCLDRFERHVWSNNLMRLQIVALGRQYTLFVQFGIDHRRQRSLAYRVAFEALVVPLLRMMARLQGP